MIADRTNDGEQAELAPELVPHPALGPDRRDEPHDQGELASENEMRDRAVGELASENADLYKRIGALESELKAKEAKFDAWAKTIAARDDERSARDEARAEREEALAGRVEELERRLAARPAADPGGSEPRIGAVEPPGRQTEKRNPERLWRSNEAIAVYASGGGTLLAAYAEAAGAGAAADVTGMAGVLAGFGAAAIALARKHREARHADRPRD